MNNYQTLLYRLKNMLSPLLILLGLLFSSAITQAQAPNNDDPCAAVVLPVSGTCTYQTFTTLNSTPSTGYPAPGCAAFLGDDVWFQITVPAGGAIIINTIQGGITDGGMALYSGDCNTMALIECDDDDSENGLMPLINRTGLTPGSTVFVRFWKYNGGVGGTFGICVTTPPPPPANDACANAVPLTVNPSFICTSTATGTTISATASTGVPVPSCGATGVADDVWYRFVATNANHQVSLTGVTGTTTDMVMAVYSGTCAALTQVACSDPNILNVTGLIVGQTYYVRVWTFPSTNVGANFTICIGTPPPPPANDNCAGAIPLTVNSNLLCAVTTVGSTASALPSTGVPAPTCGATGVNDDVWYSFVAVQPFHTISLTGISGIVTDMVMTVYSGANCGALTQLQCSDPNTMSLNGLVPGQTYYVRVWTFTATVGSFANFTICVGTPPPPPANDDACNAITLNVAENGACNFQTFTNQSATGSNVPSPGCASYSGGDVWFRLTVPCSGSIIIDSRPGVMTDGGMAIYSGTCGNLTFIECDDDDSPNGLMPRISRTGLVPGSTLWVRFWEYGNDNNGTFDICASIPPPAPPASTCATAQPFCTSTNPFTVPNITDQPSLGGGGVYGCLATTPNPTFYYLQIQNSGNIDITISQTSNTGTALDVDFIVWGPFNNLGASCTGISAANIVDCSYSIANVEIANIPNAVAGQFYLFLVTNFSNSPGTITYQQTGGTGSSNCSIICNLNAGNNGPICIGGTVNLTANNVPNATYSWTGPNCFSSTLQNPTGVAVPTTPGQYTYTVTATGPNGITCTDTTIVTVNTRPNIGADTAIIRCAGTAINLTSLYNTATLTPVWTLNGVVVANPTAVTVTGIYRLIASNLAGCRDTAFANIILSTVSADVSAAEIICTQTGRITVFNVTGIPPYQYSISSNPGVFQTSNLFVAPAGTYTITTRDSLGCITTDVVTVTVSPRFTASAGADISIFSGDEAQIFGSSSEPASSILWTPATNLSSATTINTIAKPTSTTLYRLTATNSVGCVATDDVLITIIPYCVRVKNAFTPNGDGNNDLWQVYDDFGCLKNITVQVFNRYGNKVFESRDYRNNWNGTYSGKPVPDATYYAVLNFTLITGRVVTVKTDITILR